MQHWSWKQFDQLSRDELYELLALRQNVFIIEQDCIYPDLDGIDQKAWHLMGWEISEKGRELMAYCRLVYPGIKYEEPSIGRVVSAGESRGAGWGRALMAEAVAGCRERYPDQGARISAQSYLRNFYEGFGFEVVSDPYLEDDIPHIEMLLPA